MSLRKSPTRTPALVAPGMSPAGADLKVGATSRLGAHRRNAQKSTGPRTARGKAQSRMNRLREGGRSPLYRNRLMALLEAPPCSVDATARAVLTPEQAAHPLFAELLDIARQAEIEVVDGCRGPLARVEKKIV